MKPQTLLAWVAALFLAATLFSHTVTLRLWLLAAGIVLASITVARQRNEIRALPPIWLPFALWAIWAALSLSWSIEPDRSLKEWRNEVFYAGAALWICYVCAQTPRAARILLPVLTGGALAVCAVALYSYSLGFATYYQHGWHGGPGNHSSALLTLVPCALMVAWFAARSGGTPAIAFLALGLAAVMFASAYTTLNRTIWLGLAAQCVILGVLILRRGPALTAPAKLGLSALGAATLAAGAAMILNVQAERATAVSNRGFSNDLRLTLWPEIVERIGSRPLTGYGFGRGLLRDSLQEELGAKDNLWHAHNLFLEAVVQIGVPGLLLLVVLFAAIALVAWRFAAESDEAVAACGMALLGVLVGMLVRNMTDTLFVRQNALLFWGMTGVLLGLATRRPPSS